MKQFLTVSCKIVVTPEQLPKVDNTLLVFANVCEYVHQEIPEHLTNEIAMQSLIYQSVREQFRLPSQLAIHAIRRVSGNRKAAKSKGDKVKSFAPTSATYDSRTFQLREKDWTVSLTMIGKRERFQLHIGNYQKSLLKGQNPKSAILVVKDGEYRLNIQLESHPKPPPKVVEVLGVDLGRTDIAVTSDGESFSGKDVREIRDHYAKLRESIQKKAAKGTRSTRRRARRLLQRLSGKEKRYQQHNNHVISKHIVQVAKSTNRAISLEDLTGIRERTNQLPRSKTERRRSNSWAFYQLRQYLTYKAIGASVKLILVNPAYTSQTCHKCLHIHPARGESYRSGKKFECGHCGWIGDADWNGAKNIEVIGRFINSPGGSGLVCSLEEHLLGLLKTPSAVSGGVVYAFKSWLRELSGKEPNRHAIARKNS